jgi:hypothetical protein
MDWHWKEEYRETSEGGWTGIGKRSRGRPMKARGKDGQWKVEKGYGRLRGLNRHWKEE